MCLSGPCLFQSKCLLEIQENIPDRFLQKFMKQERNDLISTHRKEAVCCDNVTGINHDNDGGNDWSVTGEIAWNLLL